jgi:hypothetical protein
MDTDDTEATPSEIAEKIKELVLKQFPTVKFDLTFTGEGPPKMFFLDVRDRDKLVVIEYRTKDRLFGTSDCSNPEGIMFGEGPEKTHTEMGPALDHVFEILRPH